MLNDVDSWGGQTVLTHHQYLIQQSSTRDPVFNPRLQPRLLLWIRTVTMDTDCYYGYGHGYAIARPIERWWQTASISFNIRDNKRNAELLLKQSLNAFELIQLRFNFVSTSIQLRFNIDSTSIQLRFNFVSTSIQLRFNTVERGKQTVLTSLFNKIERMLKSFARALRNDDGHGQNKEYDWLNAFYHFCITQMGTLRSPSGACNFHIASVKRRFHK